MDVDIKTLCPLWNRMDFTPPQNVSLQIASKNPGEDCLALITLLQNALKTLQMQSELLHESALLARLCYIMKRKFRSDKGFKALEKINKALKQFHVIDLVSVLNNLERYSYESSGPSKEMLSLALLRLQAYTALFDRIYNTCKEAAAYFNARLRIGQVWNFALVCVGVCSRLWVISEFYLVKASEIYSKLKPFLCVLESDGSDWPYENPNFPASLLTWLGRSEEAYKNNRVTQPETRIKQEGGNNIGVINRPMKEDFGEAISRDQFFSPSKSPEANAQLNKKQKQQKKRILKINSRKQLLDFIANERKNRKLCEEKCYTKHLDSGKWKELNQFINQKLSELKDELDHKPTDPKDEIQFELYEGASVEELNGFIRTIKKELGLIKLENELFEEFLEKAKRKLTGDESDISGTIAQLKSEDPCSSSALPPKCQVETSDEQVRVGTKMSILKELSVELENGIKEKRQRHKTVSQSVSAEIEVFKISLEQLTIVRKHMDQFVVHPKQPLAELEAKAKSFAGFITDYLKAAENDLAKLRVRLQRVKVECKQVANPDIPEAEHKVDLEILKIKNERCKSELASANKEFSRVKNLLKTSHSDLYEAGIQLKNSTERLKRLKTDNGLSNKKLLIMQKKLTMVEDDLKARTSYAQDLRQLLHNYKSKPPQIKDLLRRKVNLHKLEKELVTWKHRLKITRLIISSTKTKLKRSVSCQPKFEPFNRPFLKPRQLILKSQ